MHFDDSIGWKPNCEIDGSYVAKQCRGDKLTGRLFGLFELLRGYSYMTSAFRVGGGRVREKIGRLRIGGEGRLAVFPEFLNIGEWGKRGF